MKKLEVKVPRRLWHYRLHAKKLEFEFKKQGKSMIDIEKQISTKESYCQSLIYNYTYRFVMICEDNIISLVLISISR